jgi:hypothetical protein
VNWIYLIVIVLLAGAGVTLLLVRRGPARLDRVRSRPGVFSRLQARGAALRRAIRRPRLAGAEDSGWVASPDLQPAQALELMPATKTLADEWPLGLAVTAIAAGPDGYPHQDVYYVQRNVVALARGLSAVGVAQRAAALSLSAVMTSPLGRSQDAEEALRKGVSSANLLVRSITRREPGYSDLATTLDVVFVTSDGGRPSLHFAHVGNSSLWLQRAGSAPVELLTKSHAIDGGPLLRAVGNSPEVVPDIGHEQVAVGDRIFLTTTSRYFAFTPKIMNAVTAAHDGSSLHDCAAALADAVRSSGTPEGVTIVVAEVGRPASFVA